jgi:RND superfamily putative drug exporter
VLLSWIVGLVVLGGLSTSIGSSIKDNFDLPNTESTRAINLLKQEFPAASGEDMTVVLRARQGTVTDPAISSTVTAMLAKVGKLPHVTKVASPYGPKGADQLSKDHRIAFATVSLDVQSNDVPVSDLKNIVNTARAAQDPALQVEATGTPVARAEQSNPGGPSEIVGFVAAAVVLFIAFGSLLAMTLPLITALLALVAAQCVIGLLTHAMSIGTIGPILASLIGLGVGIDYALFIVNRHRSGLRAGRSIEESAVTAVNTSGRAVLFAGATVCIALLGMFALGVSFFYGLAVAASVAVLFTMFASITLLPALLGFYGQKVLGRKERRRLAERGPSGPEVSGLSWRWARLVERRPAAMGVLAIVVIGVLATPFFSLRLGSSDQGNDPTSQTSRRGYDLLADGFGPGFNGPFLLTARINSPDDLTRLNALANSLKRDPGVDSVAATNVSPNGRAATISLFPTTSPQAKQTSDLLKRLRHTEIPAVTGRNGPVVYVGGITASYDDFARVLSGKLPLFIGIVVALAFLLLMVVFRSLLVPLMASVMNLFAVSAAFGVLVAVFQWGWLANLVGVHNGPIEAWLPVMLFAILFGLSMDYEVFLVSRMHEEWLKRRDNQAAVTFGQAETGRVISAAAAIMTLVFLSFALIPERGVKEFGLGLALAVLIDALIIRTILVPALMHLFGPANWWLPRWLDRSLPRLAVEGDVEGEIEPVPLVPAQGREPADSGTGGARRR